MARVNISVLIPVLALAIASDPLVSACAGKHSSAPGAGTSGVVSPAPTRITDPYSPKIDPATFSTTVDNPYLPMVPGTRTIYELHTSGGGTRRTTTEVTRDAKTIMGVQTVVVHDTVSLDGETVEDTFDWYAQDRDGNVWYFGEATKSIGDNGAVDTGGSFEAGTGGALPGIAMLAHPHVGDQYRQEYAKGVAEDTGEVVSLAGSQATPLTGARSDLLVTSDADGLEPDAPPETKYYARGIGLILTVEPEGPDEAVRTEKF